MFIIVSQQFLSGENIIKECKVWFDMIILAWKMGSPPAIAHEYILKGKSKVNVNDHGKQRETRIKKR